MPTRGGTLRFCPIIINLNFLATPLFRLTIVTQMIDLLINIRDYKLVLVFTSGYYKVKTVTCFLKSRDLQWHP